LARNALLFSAGLLVLVSVLALGMTVTSAAGPTGIAATPSTFAPGGATTITLISDQARVVTDFVVVDPTTTVIWRAMHPGPDLIPGTPDDPGITIGGPGGGVLAIPAGTTLAYVFPGPNFATSIAGDLLSGPLWGGVGGVAPNTAALGYYTVVVWTAVGPIWVGGFWTSFLVIPEMPLGTVAALSIPLIGIGLLWLRRRENIATP